MNIKSIYQQKQPFLGHTFWPNGQGCPVSTDKRPSFLASKIMEKNRPPLAKHLVELLENTRAAGRRAPKMVFSCLFSVRLPLYSSIFSLAPKSFTRAGMVQAKHLQPVAIRPQICNLRLPCSEKTASLTLKIDESFPRTSQQQVNKVTVADRLRPAGTTIFSMRVSLFYQWRVAFWLPFLSTQKWMAGCRAAQPAYGAFL